MCFTLSSQGGGGVDGRVQEVLLRRGAAGQERGIWQHRGEAPPEGAAAVQTILMVRRQKIVSSKSACCMLLFNFDLSQYLEKAPCSSPLPEENGYLYA